ncbi:DnaJ domain-containing protein [Bacillus andreraoultii]|uniref:DnaJ domain-containing protein n=1 Tax=Bacillus andreraoultii TaxID=1499685 RepID=UPI00053BAF96|nr:DnaJ domain-containing protein [Bacillus andreraoultii]
MNNYYELLELHMDASESEIREKIKTELSKWRKRVNAPDPQRQRLASERMELLQEAEETLLNPENRTQYDLHLQQSMAPQQEYRAAIEEVDNPTQLSLADQLIGEANNLINQNNIADAIVYAKRATEADGNHPYAWSILARAHFLWGEVQDALYEIKRAISILPNEPHFYYVLYHCQMNRNDINYSEKMNLATEAINKALNIAPNDPDYITEAARLALETKQLDYGIDLLKQLEKNQGLNPDSRNILAELYYYKGLNLTHRVDYNNGETLYYFTNKEASVRGKDFFVEASKYVTNQNLRQEIQKWIGVANNALKLKNNYKILALFLLIIPMFLISLESFNIIGILISAGAGYLAWKKGRVPQYQLNQKYINTLR